MDVAGIFAMHIHGHGVEERDSAEEFDTLVPVCLKRALILNVKEHGPVVPRGDCRTLYLANKHGTYRYA